MCFIELTKRDVPGFAIGGLSGGEEKGQFWRMVTLSTDHLPRLKPRYLMGVGFVLSLSSALYTFHGEIAGNFLKQQFSKSSGVCSGGIYILQLCVCDFVESFYHAIQFLTLHFRNV